MTWYYCPDCNAFFVEGEKDMSVWHDTPCPNGCKDEHGEPVIAEDSDVLEVDNPDMVALYEKLSDELAQVIDKANDLSRKMECQRYGYSHTDVSVNEMNSGFRVGE